MLLVGLGRSLLVAVALSALLLFCFADFLLPVETVRVAPTLPGTSIAEAATATVPAPLAPLATPQDTQAGVDAVAQ